ncbi:MAG: alkene reductase [Cyanobacteria bacterium P01_A01_bin.135]
MPTLFDPVQLGPLSLSNRMVMAPMTRLRATDGLPQPIMATYYAQRASAGLIISECTMVSPMSSGYVGCPGIYTDAQVETWKPIVEAVHEAGGKIFLQLWHCGRISHPALLDGKQPVAPSAIAAEGTLHTPEGKVDIAVPRALGIEEIPGIIDEFRHAAINAKAAGFDGVELHGAFGYLIDQFLQDGANQRTDAYGGPVENRARFLLEVVDAVCAPWGADRVGIKLSPSNTYYSMKDSDPRATFSYVLKALEPKGLAYVHLMEPNENDRKQDVIDPVVSTFRPVYGGTIMANGGFDHESGNQVLAEGNAALVSFGRLFLANPDLPERFKQEASLNEPNPRTFYGGGEAGYTDYPFLEKAS